MYDCYYAWLCMIYDIVWVCMTMYDYLWHCFTMFDSILLSRAMYENMLNLSSSAFKYGRKVWGGGA